MVKVLEYMAVGRPIVSFDLPESRRSAGGAALYASAQNVSDFAALVERLLDDPNLRSELGSEGRARVDTSFSWARSELALLTAYDRALGRKSH